MTDKWKSPVLCLYVSDSSIDFTAWNWMMKVLAGNIEQQTQSQKYQQKREEMPKYHM